MFISWLTDEVRQDPADMQGVQELVRKFDAQEIIAVTSVVTLTEVLESSLTTEAQDRFKSLRQIRVGNFYMAEVNLRIAELAHELRNYYKGIRIDTNSPNLSVPDAIHLATAVSLDCDWFYTFDGSGNDPVRRNTLALLPLSGQLAGGLYDLRIAKPPPAPQSSMPYAGPGIEGGIISPAESTASDG